MKTIIFLLMISSFASAQDMDIVGKLKVGQLPPDNASNKIVVHKSDGMLGTRDVNSLMSTPVDTSRSLGSDLDLFKALCQCSPSQIPPSVVRKMLQSGYSEEDLSLMGVSQEQIRRSKPVKDWEGNVYTVMGLPNNEGMYGRYILKENLRTKYFNDGTLIVGPLPDAGWQLADSQEQPAFAYPNNDPANEAGYGLLYNGHVIASNKNPCPLGFKPIDIENEFGDLFGSSAAELKSPGIAYWAYPNDANNFSGLGFRASGYRLPTGEYENFRTQAILWDDNFNFQINAIKVRAIIANQSNTFNGGSMVKGAAAGIRCISDGW